MHNLVESKKKINKLSHCFLQTEGPLSQPNEPTEAGWLVGKGDKEEKQKQTQKSKQLKKQSKFSA